MKTATPKNRLKILDWYCHQGHQYEFFKTGHDFFLCGVDGLSPNWNEAHRPKNKNVHFISEQQALRTSFDIIMVRSPISLRRCKPHIKRGAVPVAVVQVTNSFPIPGKVKHVVWNSYEVMKKHKHVYPRRHHHYIVHGYDPDEFINLGLSDNGRVLTVANVFKGRSRIMGYPLWDRVNKHFKNLDIIGHGNSDIDKAIKEAASFDELIKAYNEYSIYFNTTYQSAMPRSRAEAAMCGMPIVTTNNFDISRYFKHRTNAIVTNDISQIHAGIKDLLNSKNMRQDYSELAREVAIKNFHIDEYLDKWNGVFERL